MSARRDPPVFPYERVWEDFTPEISIAWEFLRSRSSYYTRIFTFPDLPQLKFSACDKPLLHNLVQQLLPGNLSDELVSKLYLLAGFHLTNQFQKSFRVDLEGQRPVLKRLEQTSRAFWLAANAVSAEVRILLFEMHRVQSDTLVPNDQPLHISNVLCEAYDIALLAARVLEETRPVKTGRRPNFWRDTVVRLAASAIEDETGSPIRTSRGNSQNPAPHFTNGGGILLKRFLALLEPRTDEAQIVQSLLRTRRRRGRT